MCVTSSVVNVVFDTNYKCKDTNKTHNQREYWVVHDGFDSMMLFVVFIRICNQQHRLYELDYMEATMDGVKYTNGYKYNRFLHILF
jgi:hypothetical protein